MYTPLHVFFRVPVQVKSDVALVGERLYSEPTREKQTDVKTGGGNGRLNARVVMVMNVRVGEHG